MFSPEAVQLIHHYSKGIPRLINLICEHALISAYVEQIKPVPARIVESVSAELDLAQQPFVISPMALSGLSEDLFADRHLQHHQPRRRFHRFLEDS